MRARDLVEDYPLVRLGDDALTAARLIADQHRPAVVVVDEQGRPVAVLPGSQVLRFSVPGYVLDDPSLSRVYDERGGAEVCVAKLAKRTVKDVLPPEDKRLELPVVSGGATVLECAATMARLRVPLVVVVDADTIHGVVTASHLLAVILEASEPPA
ncbi:CBS domain-containing protein [Umezawaea sp. Da 62-37]|uniref:CBS domain-containing protein n=1 Tax=Umezawaea sp. Da 62-37 TaxID=3075927 RepID=UPI0028F6C4C7|nr:CBS domain-containing protein [Umezawaea sp. Da 62-37]WNV85155.1 CBS domain-containing protein [Umezawaea sp. Da 62-37]